MNYGKFSPDFNEYIISRPDTPRPWVNYLFNNKYHAIISQTAGGFSYCRDPKYNRIHKYERVYTDRPGRYVYFIDQDTNEKWSATWQPMMKPYQKFEARHGLGYTIISSQYFNIESKLTFFVPLDAAFEICIIDITNCSKHSRQLKIFPGWVMLVRPVAYKCSLRYKEPSMTYTDTAAAGSWLNPKSKPQPTRRAL